MSETKSGGIFVKIRFLLPTLPRAEKAFAKYLLSHPEVISESTLAELTNLAKCSESAVIRFAQRLQLGGYTDLKNRIKESLDEYAGYEGLDLSKCDSIDQIVTLVFEHNMRTLKDTLALANPEYDRAVDALINATSIHFFGTGDAGLVGELAHMKFLRLGLHGSAYSDANLQLTAASTLKPGDVAIAITHSGRTKTTVHTLQLAKDAGATTICITNMERSPATKYADIKIFTAIAGISADDEFVSRRIAEQAIIEALYLAFLKKSHKDYSAILETTSRTFDRLK